MTTLTKSLGVVRGAALMLNIVVGAGLLALPGLAVEAAGDQALWSWLACAVAALPLLVVCIIMGRSHPDAGGVAHFARTAFGEAGYLATSLIFLGAVVFGLPAIALTGGHYITGMAGGSPPHYAAGIIIAAAAANMLSPDLSGRISTFAASLILIALAVIVTAGLSGIDWAALEGRVAAATELDAAIVMAPFMMIFFAFTGWEVAAGLSEEFRNPRRDFPRAMILSFAIAVALYVAMGFIVQAGEMSGAPEAAFVGVARSLFGAAGSLAVGTLAAVIILANLLGALWAVSRLVYALGRDGHLPVRLGVTASGTPVSSVALTAGALLLVLAAEAVGLLDIRSMLAVAGQNLLILYGMAGAALLRLSAQAASRIVAALALALTAVLLIAEGPAPAYPLALAGVGWLILRWRRFSADRAGRPRRDAAHPRRGPDDGPDETGRG